MPAVSELLIDLASEHGALDAVLSAIGDDDWTTATPAAGWDVRDTVSHLSYFDHAATLAITDPDRFEQHKTEMIGAMAAGEEPDVAAGRAARPAEVLATWRQTRRAFLAAATDLAAEPHPRRVRWYGPDMSLASFTTARIMETWAHGQDVRDAIGARPEVSDRLKHVVHLGVTARPFAFAVHGVTDPGDPVAVEAEAPAGERWLWGPADAADRITGSALDLALVFTQRRHPSRTGVVATGATAELWLSIAQAFAGPPTTTALER